jgi:predicted amidohydrolase
MVATWDLLVRGGTLVDPAQSISAKRDVAFSSGKVAAVAETLTGEAIDVIDARGALVTPGLIDLHTHVYHGLATGRHADQTCLANGVTTVVDAGSAGWMTLRGLRDYVIPTYRTRVYAFLHISATGLTINRVMPELAEIKFAQVEEAARTVSEHRALVLGIKVRIAHGATGQDNPANALEALRRARRAADLAKVPLMVHVSDTPISLEEILDHLRQGDIATHIFNGNLEQVLGRDGRVRGAVRRQRAWRGAGCGPCLDPLRRKSRGPGHRRGTATDDTQYRPAHAAARPDRLQLAGHHVQVPRPRHPARRRGRLGHDSGRRRHRQSERARIAGPRDGWRRGRPGPRGGSIHLR